MSKDKQPGKGGSKKQKPAATGTGSRPVKVVTVPPSCLDEAGLALLDRGLAAIDPRLSDPGLRDDLVRYVRELELWNPRLGLVEASGAELITKHILDCLAAVPSLIVRLEGIRERGAWPADRPLALADIGSGAGLPGVLLALALRRLSPLAVTMTLVEKQQRRVGFLLNVKALLGLRDLEVCQDSLEAVGTRQPGRFALVTARAFRPLEGGIVRELGRLLAAEGELFLFKGRRDRIAEELAAAGLMEGKGVQIAALAVPGLEEERHLVLVAARAIT